MIIGAVGWYASRDDGPVGDEVSVTTTTQAALPPTTSPVDEPFATLAASLPSQLDGYRPETGAKATGALDLEAAVAAESDTQAERALLETRRYEAGYGRAFTNDDADVYMAVYDFASPNDATLYLDDGFITLYGEGATTYELTGVPGGRGFSQGVESDGRPTIVHGAAFAKDDRFYLVFRRSASTSTPADVEAIALDLAT